MDSLTGEYAASEVTISAANMAVCRVGGRVDRFLDHLYAKMSPGSRRGQGGGRRTKTTSRSAPMPHGIPIDAYMNKGP